MAVRMRTRSSSRSYWRLMLRDWSRDDWFSLFIVFFMIEKFGKAFSTREFMRRLELDVGVVLLNFRGLIRTRYLKGKLVRIRVRLCMRIRLRIRIRVAMSRWISIWTGVLSKIDVYRLEIWRIRVGTGLGWSRRLKRSLRHKAIYVLKGYGRLSIGWRWVKD